MITVIDYGMGNLGSVRNMVAKVGGTTTVASTAADVAVAQKLILPGVGAFNYGMAELLSRDLISAIRAKALSGTPLLGICLGMQLLASSSEEGDVPGLGLVEAGIRRFHFPAHEQLAVPHVGWRDVTVVRDNPLLARDGSQRFYFTHSYHAVCKRPADVIATADYGYTFTAAFGNGSVYGTQFHPEKSHQFGMAVIDRFIRM